MEKKAEDRMMTSSSWSLPPDLDALRPWAILATIPGLGPRSLNPLLARFGTPEALLAADAARLATAGAKPAVIARLRDPRPDLTKAALDWARDSDTHLLARPDPRYPARLGELVDAPLLLYVRGDPKVLSDPQVAIVGSRNPTPGARETTLEFAHHLAACGLTITSGLAVGIDAAAHLGALEAGHTLAVMGTGPDRVYPAAHRDLARRIAAQGALVTEFPPGTGPRSEHFPRRNRLIAALSLGTLVVEAAPQSGSLITARLAVELGREVFAIPGSIHNPLARGCHALIKQGAKLVETAQDVLEELAPLLAPFLRPELPPPLPSLVPGEGAAAGGRGEAPGGDAGVPGGRESAGSRVGMDPDYLRLLAAMGDDLVPADLLIQRTGLPANQVSAMLLMLELEGRIAAAPGGRYCRLFRPPP
jgi:DNA processing protein